MNSRLLAIALVGTMLVAGCSNPGSRPGQRDGTPTTTDGPCPGCGSGNTTDSNVTPGNNSSTTAGAAPLQLEFFECTRLIAGYQFEQQSVQAALPAGYEAVRAVTGLPAVRVGTLIEHCKTLVIGNTTVVTDVRTFRSAVAVLPPEELDRPTDLDTYVLEWIVDKPEYANALRSYGFTPVEATITMDVQANEIQATVSVDGSRIYAIRSFREAQPGGPLNVAIERDHQSDGTVKAWADTEGEWHQTPLPGSMTILEVTGGKIATLAPELPRYADSGILMTIHWKTNLQPL